MPIAGVAAILYLLDGARSMSDPLALLVGCFAGKQYYSQPENLGEKLRQCIDTLNAGPYNNTGRLDQVGRWKRMGRSSQKAEAVL